jgi:hypothetical protein
MFVFFSGAIMLWYRLRMRGEGGARGAEIVESVEENAA